MVPGVLVDPAPEVEVPETLWLSSQVSVLEALSVPELSVDSGPAVSVLDGLGTVMYVVTDPLTIALVEMEPVSLEGEGWLLVPDSVPGVPSLAVAVLESLVPEELSESTEVGDSGEELSMVEPAEVVPDSHP